MEQEREAESRLDQLQDRLGLVFKRRELLREAMTHTSWINERGDLGRDNERLEYLGDAVLELVAGEYLFSRFPNYDEGQLTQMRSSLVSTVALARLGEQLQLGETLRLGRGATKSGARRLTSLHANAFEALVGAIFLDHGYRRAGRVFLSRIGDLSAWTDPNFKGRLQALAQERFGFPPQYRTTVAPGDPRSRQYLSQVSVEGQPQLGEGMGGTKQAAEQAAARAAIDLLVAPVSKKRRRRSRSTDSSGPRLEQTSQPSTTGVSAPAVSVVALPERLGSVASGTGTPPPATVAPPSSGDKSVGLIGPPTAKRRRRRSTKSPAAPLTDVGPAPYVSAVPVTVLEPIADENTHPDQVAAPSRRRRRRSPKPSATEVPTPNHDAQTLEAAVPTLAESSPTPIPSEEGGTARRRTHRGHRGGRRRSGRAATPET